MVPTEKGSAFEFVPVQAVLEFAVFVLPLPADLCPPDELRGCGLIEQCREPVVGAPGGRSASNQTADWVPFSLWGRLRWVRPAFMVAEQIAISAPGRSASSGSGVATLAP